MPSEKCHKYGQHCESQKIICSSLFIAPQGYGFVSWDSCNDPIKYFWNFIGFHELKFILFMGNGCECIELISG